jgi:signal transduction histidine kinase
VPSPSLTLPPTGWLGETWRLGLVTIAGLMIWFAQFALEPTPTGPYPLLDLVLGIGAIVALRWRRRRPVTVAVICVVVTAASAMAVPAALLAMISLVSSRGWRLAVVVAALGSAAALPNRVVRPESRDDLSWWAELLATLAVYGVAVVVGLLLRARRELAQSKREAATNAEREQAARLDQARANERSRIAREMHDVLAHRISLVAMHAGAMTYRTDLSRDELLNSARVVQENAHQALTDLRDVLGVLRETTDSAAAPAAPAAPQPVLADLPELVAEAEAAGTPVHLLRSGLDLGGVPELVGRTAYRIIQEGLTNARKHAPGCLVEVRLSGTAGDRLEIKLCNRVPVRAGQVALPGAGVGLVGLRERADLAGGGLSHGATPNGDFVVRAWLPWSGVR